MMFYILCAMSSTNKKSLKRGLTPSRKKAHRPAKFDALDALDAVHGRCHGLAAVAGLLEAQGGTEPLDATLVRDTGTLMRRELEAIQALLETVWKGAAQ
jgi:hypothetical protein